MRERGECGLTGGAELAVAEGRGARASAREGVGPETAQPEGGRFFLFLFYFLFSIFYFYFFYPLFF
jgi:hypothetical protein